MAANSSSCAVLLQIPSNRDSAEIRIDQNRPVAVVPGQAQQSGLPGPISFQALAQFCDRRVRATGDGAENVSGGREARFDTR